MSERELLELAAKAAGKDLRKYQWELDAFWQFAGDATNRWNPLTDDGDRYRLAKALGLQIDFEDKEVVFWLGDSLEYISFDDGDDARAVVRAAAEIGRAMP